jgi:hypothetical protein
MPITGNAPASCASTSRLPGSTGMPACNTQPPAMTTAAGTTSARSTVAAMPDTSSSPGASVACIMCVNARATDSTSWATICSATSAAPIGARRAATAVRIFVSTDSAVFAARVSTNPTRMRCQGAIRSAAPAPASTCSTCCNAAAGTA